MSILYVVATPIGNLKDVSSRCLETLENCDYIIAEDTRYTLKLLSHYNIHKKLISYHEHNEKIRSEEIIKDMKENDIKVALVTDAGTPCISDPGFVIVEQARKEGIEVIGISGPSAVITALSVSGFEINAFVFYGFLSRENKEKREELEKIKVSTENIFVLYESPKRIKKLLEDLYNEFPNSEVCVCCDLTKLHEKTITGKIEYIKKEIEDNPNSELGEYVVILKRENIEIKKEEISLEALLLDYLIKNENKTLKDAKEELNKKGMAKNKLYEAGENLKNINERIRKV